MSVRRGDERSTPPSSPPASSSTSSAPERVDAAGSPVTTLAVLPAARGPPLRSLADVLLTAAPGVFNPALGLVAYDGVRQPRGHAPASFVDAASALVVGAQLADDFGSQRLAARVEHSLRLVLPLARYAQHLESLLTEARAAAASQQALSMAMLAASRAEREARDARSEAVRLAARLAALTAELATAQASADRAAARFVEFVGDSGVVVDDQSLLRSLLEAFAGDGMSAPPVLVTVQPLPAVLASSRVPSAVRSSSDDLARPPEGAEDAARGDAATTGRASRASADEELRGACSAASAVPAAAGDVGGELEMSPLPDQARAHSDGAEAATAASACSVAALAAQEAAGGAVARDAAARAIDVAAGDGVPAPGVEAAAAGGDLGLDARGAGDALAARSVAAGGAATATATVAGGSGGASSAPSGAHPASALGPTAATSPRHAAVGSEVTRSRSKSLPTPSASSLRVSTGAESARRAATAAAHGSTSTRPRGVVLPARSSAHGTQSAPAPAARSGLLGAAVRRSLLVLNETPGRAPASAAAVTPGATTTKAAGKRRSSSASATDGPKQKKTASSGPSFEHGSEPAPSDLGVPVASPLLSDREVFSTAPPPPHTEWSSVPRVVVELRRLGLPQAHVDALLSAGCSFNSLLTEDQLASALAASEPANPEPRWVSAAPAAIMLRAIGQGRTSRLLVPRSVSPAPLAPALAVVAVDSDEDEHDFGTGGTGSPGGPGDSGDSGDSGDAAGSSGSEESGSGSASDADDDASEGSGVASRRGTAGARATPRRGAGPVPIPIWNSTAQTASWPRDMVATKFQVMAAAQLDREQYEEILRGEPWEAMFDDRERRLRIFRVREQPQGFSAFAQRVVEFMRTYRRAIWEHQHWVVLPQYLRQGRAVAADAAKASSDPRVARYEEYFSRKLRANAMRTAFKVLDAEADQLYGSADRAALVWYEPALWGRPLKPVYWVVQPQPSYARQLELLDDRQPIRVGWRNASDDQLERVLAPGLRLLTRAEIEAEGGNWLGPL